VLINQAHIERTLLAPRRVDADNVLKSVNGGGMAWTADFMRVQKFPLVTALLYNSVFADHSTARVVVRPQN
jgi:hypothetical protein